VNTIIATLLPIASVGVGCFLLYLAWKGYTSSRNMNEWELTQGTITKSEVKRAGAALMPDIEYQYFVLGVEYEGNSVTIPPDVFYDTQLAQGLLAEYPVGKKVDVYYNPELHRVAVLVKQAMVGSWWAASLLAIMAFSFLLLGFAFLFS